MKTETGAFKGRMCGITPDTSMRVSPVPRMALSLEEAGKAIGLCSKSVAKLITDGRLRAVNVGTRRLIPISEVQCWLDREAAESFDREAKR